jgi:signal transduction histidine kinase
MLGTVMVGSVIAAAGVGLSIDKWQKSFTAADIARAQAEARDGAKRQILRYLFHELRVPLNSIALGVANELEEVAATQDAVAVREHAMRQERLTTILEQAFGMGHLLDDFLTFQKIEAGFMSADVSPVDLRKLLNDCIRQFAAPLEAKGMTIAVEEELPLVSDTVWTDPNKLRQCVSNFVSNSIKFSQPGGKITGPRSGPVQITRPSAYTLLRP